MCQCTHSLYIKDRDRLLTGFWTLHYRVLVSLYLVLDTSKLMSDVASYHLPKKARKHSSHIQVLLAKPSIFVFCT